MWWSSLFENMRPSDFFNFSFFPKYGTAFVRGIEYTLLLAVVSVLLAVVPALLLALMRLSKNKPIKWLAGAYIAVFRSTPMLVQLSIIYYGLFYAISLPRITLFGFVDISRFIPGVVALALNSSAYVAEIFRAGILAVEVDIHGLVRQIHAVKIDGAGGGLLQQVQAPQQRGFAAAGGADDGHHLALADLQITIVQRVNGAMIVFLYQILYRDQNVIACRHDAFSFRWPRLPWRPGS